MEGDEVRLAEQILQVPVLRCEFLLDLGGWPAGVVIEDAHGEPAGTAGQGLPDSAEAHDAEGLVMDVLTQHHERPPDPRGTGAEETVAFCDTPGRRHHQGKRGVRSSLGQDLRGVGGKDSMPCAGVHIDVVEAHGVVRHDLELGPGGIQELVVDPVGEERDRSCLAGHLRQELVAGHGAFAVVKRHVAPGLDSVQCLLRQAAGDENPRTRPAHR